MVDGLLGLCVCSFLRWRVWRVV
uniref:Uncharacterized protein n=1 Tax=Arundo donax TaxID=35708 RepID=A0A0A9GVX9_ARUDO